MFHNKPHNRQNLTYGGSATIKRAGPYDYDPYTKTNHGGSVYFDGNGDYISFPDNDAFDLAGDFAIEFWFNRKSVVSGTYCALFGGNGSSGSQLGWNFYITNSNGTISFYHGSFLLSYAEGVKNNIWYHVAVTRSGTDLKLFVNGKERATATNSTTFNQNDDNTGGRIGYDMSANGYFNGYIADARVVNGSAVYTSTFAAPTAPLTAITNTKLLTCTNKHSTWDQGSGIRIKPVGTAAASNTTRKFTSSSAMFMDGNSDYFEIVSSDPLVDLLNFGTQDFTIEVFVRPEITNQNYPSFISSTSGWNAGASGHRFDNTGYGSKFWFGLNGASGRNNGDPFMHSTNNFLHELWHHYAITRSGNTFRMFINGALEDTQTYTGSYNMAHGGCRLGWATWDGGAGYFYGYIQDLRVTKGFARYTSAFTAPTATFQG